MQRVMYGGVMFGSQGAHGPGMAANASRASVGCATQNNWFSFDPADGNRAGTPDDLASSGKLLLDTRP
jgi:hypothetical protein